MLRQLLKTLVRMLDERSPLRPPGARPEAEFFRLCIKCGKCQQICPYDSIRPAPLSAGRKLGTPIVVPRAVPCYVCMKCPPICPTGALDNAVTRKEQVHMGTAVIDTTICLPYIGVICRACFERCPIYREAITLRDELYPEVNSDACIGCGICEHVCPSERAAITIRSAHQI